MAVPGRIFQLPFGGWLEFCRLWRFRSSPKEWTTASQVDDYLDDAIDAWVASGKSKTFVIGEGQRRIGQHIRKELAGDALEFRKVWPKNMQFKLDKVTKRLSPANEATLIDFNKHLIRRLHEKGFKFLDIGRDGRAVGSKFYEAELQVLRELGVIK